MKANTTVNIARKQFNEYHEKIRESAKTTWESLSEDQQLDILYYVGQKLVEHAVEGGSYRYLLYERLGLSMAAYCHLLDSYMTISNEFVIAKPVEENQLFSDFKEIIDKIPAYLSKEDEVKFNFNTDRGFAYNFFFMIREMNNSLSIQEERYNRLKSEFDALYKDYQGLLNSNSLKNSL